jgi:hypothetical protein
MLFLEKGNVEIAESRFFSIFKNVCKYAFGTTGPAKSQNRKSIFNGKTLASLSILHS